MNKEEALREILSRWRSLPETERQTESHAAAFAMRMANDIHSDAAATGIR